MTYHADWRIAIGTAILGNSLTAAQRRKQLMYEPSESPELPTAAEILDADDETLEALVVGYVEARLELQPSTPFDAFASLSRKVQYVYATALLEGEVESGGFNQYFYNSSSDYALEALAGYRAIGAAEHARQLQKAIEVFHAERWFHFRIRQRRSLDAFFDSYQFTRLSQIDEHFLEIEDDPIVRRASYIRDHLGEFSSP